jgi:uncharacterized protein
MTNESELTIDSNGYKLAGSLIICDDAAIIALLISGSGPIDRNSNSKKIKLNVSLQLAQALRENGISSFRFDKRGIGKSERDYWQATFEDNIEDATAILDFLKKHYPHSKYIIIGHSEGALIATRVAAKSANLAGIVLLAGSLKNGRQLLRWQLHQVISTLQGFKKWLLKLLPINPEHQQLKLLEKIAKSKTNTIRISGLKKINAGWFRQLLSYDPLLDFRKINCPILAITGKKDLQVPVDDLNLMESSCKGAITTHAIDDLTHLLRKDVQPPSVSHYKKLLKMPVDKELITHVLAWLNSLS